MGWGWVVLLYIQWVRDHILGFMGAYPFPLNSGFFCPSIFLYNYLKLEQGWMTQCPYFLCLSLSLSSAVLEPNSFIESLLLVGSNIFRIRFRIHPDILFESLLEMELLNM